MNVATARSLVKAAVLSDANDSGLWTNLRVDLGIQLVMDWANNIYHLVTGHGTVAVANKTVSNASWSSPTVTITTSGSHGLAVGEQVFVESVTASGGDGASYNGFHQILTVPGATSFTYKLGTISPGTFSSGGAVWPAYLDLSSIESELTRRRFLRARRGLSPALEQVNFDHMLVWYDNHTIQGEPSRCAFEEADDTKMHLHPAPDDTYTYTVKYLDLPTSWTAGGSDPGTLNIPDDIMRCLCVWGVVAVVQGNYDVEVAARTDKWGKMITYLQNIATDQADLGIDQKVPLD